VISGLVFDLDDTLSFERDYVLSGFAHVANAAGRTSQEVEEVKRWLLEAFDSGVRGDTFDRLLRAFPQVAERMTLDDLMIEYRGHDPHIELIPDMAQTLDALHQLDIRLGVLTDGPEISQAAKAQALELARWFDPIVLTEKLGHGLGKPATAGFELIAGLWGLPPSALSYVADNPEKDFRGPNTLGWTSIRLRDPRQLRHELEPTSAADKPALEIHSPSELLDLGSGTGSD
jgi:putative hydrolase of the HAD superfamily